jgi:hypothetical protein
MTMQNSVRLLDGASTTSTFDRILREMYTPDAPSRSYDETEWDPAWYSTD